MNIVHRRGLLGVPGLTPAAAILGAVWLAALAAGLMLGGTADAGSPCLFHRATGVPCPMCGGLRATNALAHARFGEAFAWNPLAITLVLATPLLLACVLFPPPRISSGLRALIWSLAAAAVIANWAYVIRCGR